MAKTYRKKPVVIQAMQWDGTVAPGLPITRWIRDNGGQYTWTPGTPQHLAIVTLEGEMVANAGDWIIRGVQGEFYPCRGDIFEATYDAVV